MINSARIVLVLFDPVKIRSILMELIVAQLIQDPNQDEQAAG
jgi:hypothetical protein